MKAQQAIPMTTNSPNPILYTSGAMLRRPTSPIITNVNTNTDPLCASNTTRLVLHCPTEVVRLTAAHVRRRRNIGSDPAIRIGWAIEQDHLLLVRCDRSVILTNHLIIALVLLRASSSF